VSKRINSKLDAYAARLEQLLNPVDEGGAGMTLQKAQESLKEDGISVALSTLSQWWSARRGRMMEERLLDRIASGAAQCREVEAELADNPAPELKTLIGLHRVLILKLATEGNADAEKLELVNRMMREVQKYARLEQLQEQNRMEDRKLKLLERKAEQAEQAEGITKSDLSAEEKAVKMREIFGLPTGEVNHG